MGGILGVAALAFQTREGFLALRQKLGNLIHTYVSAPMDPYVPEHARYFWQRRKEKDARLLGALSARQLRAQAT